MFRKFINAFVESDAIRIDPPYAILKNNFLIIFPHPVMCVFASYDWNLELN